MFNKKRIIAVLLFLLLSFFMITFANPAEKEAKATRAVTFIDSYDNKQLDKKTVEVGTKVTAPEVPDHKNVVFIGWYKEDTNEKANLDNITENITVKTKYADDINNNGIADDDDTYYTVRFIDSRKDTTLKSQRVLTGMSATAPTVPSYEGYTFNGWTRGYTKVTSNIDTETIYLATNYTITFDTDGGTAIPKIIGNVGVTIVKPADPTKEGYTFAGWDQEISEVMPAKNMEIKAIWEINNYKINYNLSEDIVKDAVHSNIKTYTILDPLYTLAAATSENYIFSGWYTKAIDGEEVTTLAGGKTGDVTLYAYWTVKEYNVTFYNGDVALDDATKVPYGNKISEPLFTVPAGYKLLGWADKDGNAWDFDTNIIENDLDLYVSLEIIDYNLTFKVNTFGIVGANVPENSKTYTVNDEFTFNNATSSSHNFLGWYNEDDTKEEGIILGTSGDKTYVGKWQIKEYILTFTDTTGEIITRKVPWGGILLDIPKVTQKQGYICSWDRLLYIGIIEDDEISTKCIKNTYSLVIDPNGGNWSGNNFQLVKYEDTRTINEPTKKGYEFAGWTVTGKGSKIEGTTFTMGYEKAVLTAKWVLIGKYIVTFDTDGGSDVEDILDVTKNTTITKPTDPTKQGYKFEGWYKENTLENEWDFTNDRVTADITLYAKWTINQYDITFDANGGLPVSPLTQDYNSVIDLSLVETTKEGYNFKGWEAKTLEEMPTTMPEGGFEVIAIWEAKEYNVTFYYGLPQVSKTIKVAYENKISTDQVPDSSFVLPGHELIWRTADNKEWNFDADKVTGNVKLYAHLSLITYKLTFNYENGSQIVKEVVWNGLLSAPENTQKTGHTCKWDRLIYVGIKEDDIINEACTKNTYTLVIYPGYFFLAPFPEIKQVEYGATINIPNPTRSRYKFDSWTLTGAGSKMEGTTFTMGHKDATLTATWK